MLKDNPQYQALYYAWGDAKVTRPFNLQGVQCPVTSNLEAALRNMRYPNMGRVLWIDAICIDQDSAGELSHQVTMMKDIYSNAMIVGVWLGESTPGCREAMRIFKRVDDGVSIIHVITEDRLTPEQKSRSLTELFARPWWGRVWIIQEVALAKKLTMHYGTEYLNLETVLNALWDLNHYLCLWSSYSPVDRSFKLEMDRTLRDILNSVYWLWIEHKRGPSLAPDAFIVALGRGQLSLLSDPRDAIYGFLGLASAVIRDRIEPNYDSPLAEVLNDTAIQLTLCVNSLLLFSFTSFSENIANDIPSWMPAWRRIEKDFGTRNIWRAKMNRAQIAKLFSGSRNRVMCFNVVSTSTVRLRGVFLDYVTQQTRDSRSTVVTRSLYGYESEWTRLYEKLLGHSATKAASQYWRLLCHDIYYDRDRQHSVRCCDDDYQVYVAWRNKLNLPASTSTLLAQKFEEVFIMACTGRHLFFTKHGHAGLGPPELQLGDLIYALAGGSFLYVLRPVPSAPRPHTFQLVGDCYVQGFMDGEAVEGRKADWHDVFIE